MSSPAPQPQPSPPVLTASQRQQTHISMHRLDISDREHLVSSVPLRPDEEFQRSEVNFSRRVPDWLWATLTAMLGIGTETSNCRHLVAFSMRLMTLVSALIFAGCGLVFKAFDVMSENTKTTMLDAIGDALLAAYWVGMGIYARSLAARLFSNALFVECIQMHSKTIFKMNTAAIIMLLSTTCVATNLYASRNLLEWHGVENTNSSYAEGTCSNAGVHVALCEVYFTFRTIYSGFNLLWNLLVANILLSVCRTHTISIRRFKKELLYDNKIYEEFVMLQALAAQVFPSESNMNRRERPQTMTAILEGEGWETSINDIDDYGSRPPSNAVILNTMRTIRSSAYNANSSILQRPPLPPPPPQTLPTNADSSPPRRPIPPPPPPRILPTIADSPPPRRPSATADGPQDGDVTRRNHEAPLDDQPPSLESSVEEDPYMRMFNTILKSLGPDEAIYRRALETGQPPIMNTEDLLFKYFQFVRRLSSTSRLLQRWMSSVISLVLLWCALFILYWTSNEVTWLGLFVFTLPLVILYLLTSAYAEVNFEAGGIVKCVLPTPERVDSLDHVREQPPELKVFSFKITHNAIMTVVAGVAVSFATSLVLEQIMG